MLRYDFAVAMKPLRPEGLSYKWLWIRGGREDGFEVEFAGFGEFEGAGEVGAAGRFEEDGVGTGREFERGGGVAVEFAVNVDFRSVGLGSDGELAVAVGRSRWDGR